MKRHPALRPLSHDHHHGLVEARRLHKAADGGPEPRRSSAAGFLRFYSSETIRHFREEEEELFPMLVDEPDPAGQLLIRALLEHQRLHALADRLDRVLAAADPDPALMRELGELLERHIRFEERTLFPFIESSVPEERLGRLVLAAARDASAEPVVDLFAPRGRGPSGAPRRTISTRPCWPGTRATGRPSTSMPSGTCSWSRSPAPPRS